MVSYNFHMYNLQNFLIKRANIYNEGRDTVLNYDMGNSLAAELSMLNHGSISQQISAKEGAEAGKWLGGVLAGVSGRKQLVDLADDVAKAYEKGIAADAAKWAQSVGRELVDNLAAGSKGQTALGKVVDYALRPRLGKYKSVLKALPGSFGTRLGTAAAKIALGGLAGYAGGGVLGHLTGDLSDSAD